MNRRRFLVLTAALAANPSFAAAPRRVVALSEFDLDATLALHAPLVGATQARGLDAAPTYLGDAAHRLPSVGQFATPVLDRVIGLAPDLILAGGIANPTLMAQLARIATTLVSFKPGEDWQVALGRVAAACGRDAAPLLARYRRRAAWLKAKLPPGRTASVVRWAPQGPAYMLSDSFVARVLGDAGLGRPPAQRQPGAGHSSPLSLEALSRIDADWLFVGAFGNAQAVLDAARGSSGFARLHAALAGQVRVVDASLWTGIGGPLAAFAIQDELAVAFGAGKLP
jgi:iron complex transport system substrate-binding protein